MAKFNRLDIPATWERYWSKYPQGYTIMEALINWVNQVNHMTDNVNELYAYLDDFVATFDTKLQDNVKEVIQSWIDDGVINVIIGEALQSEIDGLGEWVNNADKIELNILDEGGEVNNPNIDSTNIIQTAINKIHDLGGGTLVLPAGHFYIKGTIKLRRRVKIKGVSSYPWGEDISYYTDWYTVLFHTPDMENNNLFDVEQSDKTLYIPNASLEGLVCVGNANSNIGLNALSVCNFDLISCLFTNFNIGAKFTGSMTSTISKSRFVRSREACVLFSNDIISTTTNFYDCYFGQSYEGVYDGSVPLMMEVYSCILATFTNCVFEATNGAITIDSENDVSFVNIYTENIPHTGASPTFILGESGTSNNYHGNINFNGGIVNGTNYDIKDGSVIFDVYELSTLTVTGVHASKARRLINNNLLIKGITFVGLVEVQITHNLYMCNEDDRIDYINCKSDSVPYTQTYNIYNSNSWSSVTYQNGVTAYQTGTVASVNGLNQKQLEVSLTVGANYVKDTVLFTLPDSVRPKRHTYMEVLNLSTGTKGPELMIRPDGDVRLTADSSSGAVLVGVTIYF